MSYNFLKIEICVNGSKSNFDLEKITNHYQGYNLAKAHDYLRYSKLYSDDGKILESIIAVVIDNNAADGSIYELAIDEKEEKLSEHLVNIAPHISEQFNDIGIIR